MKHISFVMGSMILGVITIFIIMAINGRMLRKNEVSDNLPVTVEDTVKNASVTQNYPIANNDEYVADFIENFANTITSNSDVTVNIMGANRENGLLSVETIETFKHPNGRTGTVKDDRTVIRNYIPLNDEQHTIRFYLSQSDLANGTNSYKVYTVSVTEDSIPCPADPAMDGKTFAGWNAEGGVVADFAVSPTEDFSFYATWN